MRAVLWSIGLRQLTQSFTFKITRPTYQPKQHTNTIQKHTHTKYYTYDLIMPILCMAANSSSNCNSSSQCKPIC